MLRNYIRYAAWAWMIVIGGLLIFLPHGPVICIVCGGPATLVTGVITAGLGIIAIGFGRSDPMPGRP